MTMTIERPDVKTDSVVVIDLAACAVERMTNHLLARRPEKAYVVLHAFARLHDSTVVAAGVGAVCDRFCAEFNGSPDVRRCLLASFERRAAGYAGR